MKFFKHPDGSGTVVRVDDSVAAELAKAEGWEEVDAPEGQIEPKPVTTKAIKEPRGSK